MNGATLPIIIALSVQCLLGLIVFQSNWHRKANQAFLFLSAITAGWLGCLYIAVATANVRLAEIAIREASVFGGLILIALNFLRAALTKRNPTWGDILRSNSGWLAMGALMAAFCQTRFFIEGVHLSPSTGAVMPQYARYGTVYFAWFIG